MTQPTSSCEWTEEMIASLALGHESQSNHQFYQHMNTCDDCRSRFQEWSSLFTKASNQPTLDKETQLRIKRKVLRNARFMSWFQMFHIKKLWIAPLLAISCLFLLALGTDSSNNISNNNISNREYAFVNDPMTQHFQLVSSSQPNLHGNVWLNANSNEFLLTLDGAAPMADKDYQAWSNSSFTESNLGVLRVINGQGKIYLHPVNVRLIKSMHISLEPKGGSLAPTGPNVLEASF